MALDKRRRGFFGKGKSRQTLVIVWLLGAESSDRYSMGNSAFFNLELWDERCVSGGFGSKN